MFAKQKKLLLVIAAIVLVVAIVVVVIVCTTGKPAADSSTSSTQSETSTTIGPASDASTDSTVSTADSSTTTEDPSDPIVPVDPEAPASNESIDRVIDILKQNNIDNPTLNAAIYAFSVFVGDQSVTELFDPEGETMTRTVGDTVDFIKGAMITADYNNDNVISVLDEFVTAYGTDEEGNPLTVIEVIGLFESAAIDNADAVIEKINELGIDTSYLTEENIMGLISDLTDLVNEANKDIEEIENLKVSTVTKKIAALLEENNIDNDNLEIALVLVYLYAGDETVVEFFSPDNAAMSFTLAEAADIVSVFIPEGEQGEDIAAMLDYLVENYSKDAEGNDVTVGEALDIIVAHLMNDFDAVSERLLDSDFDITDLTEDDIAFVVEILKNYLA